MVVITTGLFLLLSYQVTGYHYNVRTFTVPLDHFNFGNNQTFHIRYLVNDTYWNATNGPIFFYTGNEGDIEWFAENTGFVWEIAPAFDALIVFAEHRYYGQSLPFGNESLTTPERTGYLSSQQAMADYIDLITYLKSNQTKHEQSPVIAFGGSYGGMLAAYIRMKYPHLIQGAIAASAPIWQFQGMIPCLAFGRVVTSAFKAAGDNCVTNIRQSWEAYDNITKTDAGRSWLSKEWHLCTPIKNDSEVQALKNWLDNTYSNLAMVNYPYPTNFLANLPANPVNSVCKRMNVTTKDPKVLLKIIFKGLSVYFNYTSKAKCLEYGQLATDNLGDRGWDYQACTEMVMPLCYDGNTDMFFKKPWDVKQYTNECYQRWKTTPQFDLAEKNYGGKNIEAASNIVFSNGLLDPWSSGGVLKNVSAALPVVLIPEGAHHLDLRASNKADPFSVIQARKIHQKFIKEWIAEYYQLILNI